MLRQKLVSIPGKRGRDRQHSFGRVRVDLHAIKSTDHFNPDYAIRPEALALNQKTKVRL